jgi:hypothetical protein
MPNLYGLLTEAQDGEAMARLGRQFGLSAQQTEAAVAALLPAISKGLKQSTATPEGLGNLLAVMGHQHDLQPMYGDPEAAFARQGRAAGNDVLSAIFGSPEVSRAVADQAQQFSGVSSSILKKLLPVLAGILISGLMGTKPGKAAAPQAGPAPQGGGGLGDILGQIFGRGVGPSAPSPSPQQIPAPSGQTIPTGPEAQPVPGGDILGQILQELQKGIQEGRIKPVIIGGGPIQIPMPGGQGGPVQIPMPGGQGETIPSGQQVPGGDILGQILRDLLGGAGGPARTPQPSGQSGQSGDLKDLSDLCRKLGAMDSVGEKVFGERFEVGRDIEQDHLDNIQRVFDRFSGPR